VQQFWKLVVVVLVIAGGAFAFLHFAPGTGPYAGTWKVTLCQQGVENALCLLRIAGDEKHPTAEVIDAPGFATMKTEDVHTDDKSLRLNLKTERGTFHIAAYAPDGQARPERLLGSSHDRAFYDMLRMDRSNLREIESGKGTSPAPGLEDLSKAVGAPSAAQTEKRLEDLLQRHGDQAVGQTALLMLAQLQARLGAPVDKLKATCARFLAGAAAYGREIALQSTAQLAQVLVGAPGQAARELALAYGEEAEKLLTDNDPPELAIGVLQTHARVLRAAGKEAEARQRDEKAAALESKIDEQFAKNSVPFTPAPPAGRTTDRVVLFELFTGAQCPPCVGADIAFDAALQVYSPHQVVFLQYHEHAPGPDALTSVASEQRLRYYDEVAGTPACIIDGKLLDEPVGGDADRGERSYAILHAALDQAMGSPAEAGIKLTANRNGDTIELTADVTDLREPGERTRLRFALVEDVVRYAARNGQRLHHHVVRDFPGGAAGMPLPEPSARRTAKVNLNELRKSLNDYLDLVNRQKPFPDSSRPMELGRLKAIAFIQNDATKHVLQAVQVDVPDATPKPGAEEKKGGHP
jgi:hypothetical protein